MSSKKNHNLFLKYFLVFYIMSCFGSLIETVWAYYRHREFILKTSLVFEWLIPIYGLGALILIFVLSKVKDKHFSIIFILSAVVGGMFEVVCSLFQEYFLGTSSWNYSSKFMPFFGGRTCLKYCLFWGIIGLLWIKILWPFLEKIIDSIKSSHLFYISIILIIIFTLDSVISWSACNRRVARYQNIEAGSYVDNFLDTNFDDEFLSERYSNIKIISE